MGCPDEPDMTPSEFRAALKSAGITQREFAAATGVNKATVSKWLGGVHPLPKWVGLALKGMTHAE